MDCSSGRSKTGSPQLISPPSPRAHLGGRRNGVHHHQEGVELILLKASPNSPLLPQEPSSFSSSISVMPQVTPRWSYVTEALHQAHDPPPLMKADYQQQQPFLRPRMRRFLPNGFNATRDCSPDARMTTTASPPPFPIFEAPSFDSVESANSTATSSSTFGDME